MIDTRVQSPRIPLTLLTLANRVQLTPDQNQAREGDSGNVRASVSVWGLTPLHPPSGVALGWCECAVYFWGFGGIGGNWGDLRGLSRWCPNGGDGLSACRGTQGVVGVKKHGRIPGLLKKTVVFDENAVQTRQKRPNSNIPISLRPLGAGGPRYGRRVTGCAVQQRSLLAHLGGY